MSRIPTQEPVWAVVWCVVVALRCVLSWLKFFHFSFVNSESFLIFHSFPQYITCEVRKPLLGKHVPSYSCSYNPPFLYSSVTRIVYEYRSVNFYTSGSFTTMVKRRCQVWLIISLKLWPKLFKLCLWTCQL